MYFKVGQGSLCPYSDWSVLDQHGVSGAPVIGHARSHFPFIRSPTWFSENRGYVSNKTF